MRARCCRHCQWWLPHRLTTEGRRIADAGRKLKSPCQPSGNSPACHIGAEGAPVFLLWGDSHARALAATFHEVARNSGVSGILAERLGCPPLLGVHRDNEPGLVVDCVAFNDSVASLLAKTPSIRRVIIAGRWALCAEGTRPEGGGDVVLKFANGERGNLNVFRAGLERTIRTLSARKVDVVFIEDVPEFSYSVPYVLGQAAFVHRPSLPTPSRADYDKRQANVISVANEIRQSYDFDIVSVADLFCPRARCMSQQGGLPLYRDSHHLSDHGAVFATPIVKLALGPLVERTR